MSGELIRFPDPPIRKEIKQFIHCKKCMEDMPGGVSPKDFQFIEAGYTEKGIQIWCNRHDMNIIHRALREE